MSDTDGDKFEDSVINCDESSDEGEKNVIKVKNSIERGTVSEIDKKSVLEVETKKSAVASKMASYGSMENFDEQVMQWDVYEEKLENYFISNDIVDKKKKVAVLLTKLSQQSFGVLRDLCYPQKLSDQTFEVISANLKSYYGKQVSIYKERSQFYALLQNTDESVTQWMGRVKHASSTCSFGANLEAFVKDKFVTGMRPGSIRDRLFEEDGTQSLAETLKMAVKKEMATDNVASCSVFHIDKPNKRGEERQQPKLCGVCGGYNHKEEYCRFRNYSCRNCHQRGHLQSVCKVIKKQKQHYMEEVKRDSNGDDCEYDGIYNLFTVENRDAMKTKVIINGVSLEMEMDTGSPVTVISMDCFRNLSDGKKLDKSKIILKGYSGELIYPVGLFDADIQWEGAHHVIPVHVVNNGGPPLLGRDFLKKFQIVLSCLNKVEEKEGTCFTTKSPIHSTINEYKSLFSNDIGKYKTNVVKLQIKEDAVPVYCRARTVPISLREKVEKELENLEEQGVISKIEFSEWATPLVPVVKPDGSLRLCGDYKITLNKNLLVDKYPIPRIDDIFLKLQGGQRFSKIDLRQAYNQIELDKESQKLCVWNTHRGLFLVHRLPYGVSSSSGIFQRIIEGLIGDLDGVAAFIDDIIVTGSSEKDHLENLDKVFKRLMEAGLKVKLGKCEFYKTDLTYLGHRISSKGLTKTQEKITAILNLKTPNNVKEVRALMGLINYYSRYITNISTIMSPIYDLTQKHVQFRWSKECEDALKEIKARIVDEITLVHYNPELPLILNCDASDLGISAVLLSKYPTGEEKIVATASRKLTNTEKRYSVLDKEGLAIFFGVKKFYEYLYENPIRFKVRTDHRPLLGIFGENKQIPQMVSRRVQRWAVFLAAFNYQIEYIPGKRNGLADALSRLPEEGVVNKEVLENEVPSFFNFIDDDEQFDWEQMTALTEEDELLGPIKGWINNGKWPTQSKDKRYRKFQKYFTIKNLLSLEKGVIMFGCRTVVPKKLQQSVLRELHATHMGIVKTKSLARSEVWWPGITVDIEQMIGACEICCGQRPNPPRTVNNTWPQSTAFWDRVHLDFAGPFEGHMFLILTDTFSKWPEAFIVPNITAVTTINKLYEVFARWGLPGVLVTDNGSQLVSDELNVFLQRNGIKHITSPPGHPQSNGAAENAVKTFKVGLKKQLESRKVNVSLNVLISRYLLLYRNTPHCTTKISPAEAIFKKKLRIRLDLIKPAQDEIVINPVNSKKGRNVSWTIGQKVMVKDFRTRHKELWTMAVIHKRIGLNVYLVKVDNKIWKRHTDQMNKIIQEPKFSFLNPAEFKVTSTSESANQITNVVNENNNRRSIIADRTRSKRQVES